MAIRKKTPAISAGRQFAILLEEGVEMQGQRYTLAGAAAATGISDQALANLLHGKTESPRLQTARALCRLYGISLAYFDLETEEACRAYLAHHRQRFGPATVREIVSLSDQLSPRGKRNILAILRWIHADKTPHSSSAQQ
jgi:transcriptional regulator with XRE-family HTH domain